VSAAQWGGLPENPERDGWHWLRTPAGEAPYGWFARRWEASEGEYDPVEDCSYIGPCLTPAEVASLVENARREEREAAAEAGRRHAESEGWSGTSALRLRNAIRARAAT
jgi:hypothetical protein